MTKKRLKKSSKIVIIILGIVLCAAVIFGLSKLLGNNSAAQDSQNHAEMLQDEGNLDLVIPEDQDTGGF